jgi:hypothetical protein
MLMLSAVSIPFAAARDAKRDALQHKLMQQQRQQQRWEAVMNSTGAAAHNGGGPDHGQVING